jgi:hypothetical protein
MSEREIRLDELQTLETYLDHNQILHLAMRNYVSQRRKTIIADFPEDSASVAESVTPSTPGPQLVTSVDPGQVPGPSSEKLENENKSQSQPPAQAEPVKEEQQPSEQPSGDGTQSPAPDAPQEQSSVPA